MSFLKATPVIWISRVLSAIPILMLAMSAVMKFSNSPDLIKGMEHLGINLELVFTLAILEILGLVLYAIPQTSVLGAIVLTGYLGGAILAHLRVGDSVVTPIIIGVFIWGGLYLRDHRLQALIPFKK